MASYGQLTPEMRRQIVEQRIQRLEADHYSLVVERKLQEAGGDPPAVLERTDAQIASIEKAMECANELVAVPEENHR